MINKMTGLKKDEKYRLSAGVFAVTVLLLAIVQLRLNSNPLILAERFIKGGGWLEIVAIALYGSIVVFKMQDPLKVPQWRRITWTIFSVVFFGQLLIGLSGADKFLMTGKLHLPVPMMILAGPLYRGHLSVMTILFLSTVILTGPAWCSQLCYFGVFDSIASAGKTRKRILPYKTAIKSTLILIIILVTLLLRWFNVPVQISAFLAAGFGLTGILIMIFISSRNGKMIHCILYCPIGTLVNLLKNINPFRMYIDNSCNQCMKCTTHCKYDALNIPDVKNKKPGYSCTLCGDCLAACHDNSIKYQFLRMKPDNARKLYLFMTVTLHSVFLALARI